MKRTGILTIVSLILYLFRSLICGLLIGTMHVNEVLAEGLSIFVVLAVIFFMIRGKERLTYFGICGWERDGFLKANFFLFFVPLVNLPYVFLGAGIDVMPAILDSIFIGVMEELIFRSFLCRAVEQRLDRNKAIIISSLIFGCFHLINIGNYPLIYVLLQVVYAFSMGIVFAVVFYMTKSILSCMVIHAMVDFLGSYAAEPILIIEAIGTIVCIACAVYCFFLLFRKSVPAG